MKRLNKNSRAIYRGPSRIDGADIVVLAVGLRAGKATVNAKTGDMLQTYILRADVSPLDAVARQLDGSICGGCVHRADSVTTSASGERTFNGRSCYVNLGRGVTSAWKSWSRGNVADVTLDAVPHLAAGRMVRLGTYGDPAAVPIEVWDALLRYAAGWTGYTHQARSTRFRDILKYCQVSADLEGDSVAAYRAGVGSFRVLMEGAELLEHETLCPSLQGVQCIDCGACSGMGGENIAIPAHGVLARNFTAAKLAGRRPLILPVINPARVMARA